MLINKHLLGFLPITKCQDFIIACQHKSFTLTFLSLAKLMSVTLPDLSDSSVFYPFHRAADESSEEAAFYEILPCCARFRCGELIAEGQWHHLVLVMSKGMLKNSMATLYLDGQLVSTVKVSGFTAYIERLSASQ